MSLLDWLLVAYGAFAFVLGVLVTLILTSHKWR